MPEVDTDAASVIVPTSATDRTLVVHEAGQPPRTLGEVDVVFPLLHGPFGEDGTIQGLLDLADVRYVGSGVTASAVMMDKHVHEGAARVGRAAGRPVHRDHRQGVAARQGGRRWMPCTALSWPVFVKPARAGSSMGITKVTRPRGARGGDRGGPRARPQGRRRGRRSFGREIECGVLEGHGTDPTRTSELGECIVVQNHEFYDFEAKYLAEGDVRLETPGRRAGRASRTQIREMAARAFDVAGCEGLARVDFFLTETGDVLVNEVNTMPGFTPLSMYPRMWAASGLTYPELIDELIALALERRTGLR